MVPGGVELLPSGSVHLCEKPQQSAAASRANSVRPGFLAPTIVREVIT